MKSEQLLSAETLKEHLAYDPATGVFTWRLNIGNVPSGSQAGYLHSSGYRRLTIFKRRHPEHRLAWLYMTGRWPQKQIDHINGNRSDNRFLNLREVTNQENARNIVTRKNRSGGHIGISWEPTSRRWRVRIKVDGKDKHLGYFAEKREALAARKAANSTYGYSANHGSTRGALT